MTIRKRIGAVLGASALVGASLVALGGTTASATDFTLTWNDQYYQTDEVASVTAAGCEVGKTISFGLPGPMDSNGDPGPTVFVDEVVPASGEVTKSYTVPRMVGGPVHATATCDPDGANPQTIDAEARVLGRQLEAQPRSFQLGDTIKILSGEFVSGSKVKLEVTQNGKVHWTKDLGTSPDGTTRLVSEVAFPTSLKCGDYKVEITAVSPIKNNSVWAELTLCGPEPTPSPSASAKSTASAKPTASAKTTGKVTKVKDAKRPGLPHTGA